MTANGEDGRRSLVLPSTLREVSVCSEKILLSFTIRVIVVLSLAVGVYFWFGRPIERAAKVMTKGEIILLWSITALVPTLTLSRFCQVFLDGFGVLKFLFACLAKTLVKEGI